MTTEPAEAAGLGTAEEAGDWLHEADGDAGSALEIAPPPERTDEAQTHPGAALGLSALLSHQPTRAVHNKEWLTRREWSVRRTLPFGPKNPNYILRSTFFSQARQNGAIERDGGGLTLKLLA